MSNIYNRRLDYQVDPKGKPFLQMQKTTVYPEYAVVGNTKPNLDYKTKNASTSIPNKKANTTRSIQSETTN